MSSVPRLSSFVQDPKDRDSLIVRGSYPPLVNRYCLQTEPDWYLRLHSILCRYYQFHELTVEDVSYFVSKGYDFNRSIETLGCDIGQEGKAHTFLVAACQDRRYVSIHSLCWVSADPNLRDESGYNPLEAVLIGRPFSDQQLVNARLCVKLLLYHRLRPQLKRGVVTEFCANYIRQSPFLAKVINEAEKVESDGDWAACWWTTRPPSSDDMRLDADPQEIFGVPMCRLKQMYFNRPIEA